MKKLVEEHKKMIGDSHIGKRLDKATRLKMSKTHTGMMHSEKTKEKMRISGRIASLKYYELKRKGLV